MKAYLTKEDGESALKVRVTACAGAFVRGKSGCKNPDRIQMCVHTCKHFHRFRCAWCHVLVSQQWKYVKDYAKPLCDSETRDPPTWVLPPENSFESRGRELCAEQVHLTHSASNGVKILFGCIQQIVEGYG